MWSLKSLNLDTFHSRVWFVDSLDIQETKSSAFIYTNGPLRVIYQGGDVSGEGKGHRRWHLNPPQINGALYLQATHGHWRPTAIRLQSGHLDISDILGDSHQFQGFSFILVIWNYVDVPWSPPTHTHTASGPVWFVVVRYSCWFLLVGSVSANRTWE